MTNELWLDDLDVGYRFRTDAYELTADDIVEFASKSNPSRGFITIAYDTVNQDGEVRQSSKVRLLVFARPQ